MKELAMSAVEFGLTSQPPFLNTLPQAPLEQLLTGPESLTTRYEGLSGLSRSIVSMTPEILSRNLVALLRPMFIFDFANIVIFDEEDSGVTWTSEGTDQLAPLDGAFEESTVWSVYQTQEPLWVADWWHSERLAVRKEAEIAAAIGYRSL